VRGRSDTQWHHRPPDSLERHHTWWKYDQTMLVIRSTGLRITGPFEIVSMIDGSVVAGPFDTLEVAQAVYQLLKGGYHVFK